MRIGIDARFYGSAAKGLGRYTQRLIEYLEKIDQENEYIIFLKKENWDEFVPSNRNFKKVLADYHWYTLQEQLGMPRLIKKSKVDLMHYPHFNVPIFSFCPFVVTIHDLILLQFPTMRSTSLSKSQYLFKEIAYKFVIRNAIYRAQRVITVTEYTKKQLMDYFRISKDRVSVTYEAGESLMGNTVFSDWDLKSNGVVKPYFLYVGNVYPHKNIEGLIQAFKKYIDQYGSVRQLVLVGKSDFFYERLKVFAKELGLLEKNAQGHTDVVFLGYVEQKDLSTVYKKADLYIFPSFLEGFGLPPLEAMFYKLPVLSSRASCLPEVLGDAAQFFDPYNCDQLVHCMHVCTHDQELRRSMVEKGLVQINKYSWQRCAEQTLSIYSNVFNH